MKISVSLQGPGKVDLSNNIRLFYTLTKFDIAAFAKNLEKQKKRMELVLLKTQMKLDIGSSEGNHLAGNSFQLKNLKFEELLFSCKAACHNEGQTVDGLLNDSFAYVPKAISDPKYYHPKKRSSFAYVPKAISDPKYYHPKKRSSYLTDNAMPDKEQFVDNSLLKEQIEPRPVSQVDNMECEAASSMSLDSSLREMEVSNESESERPLPTNNETGQFVSSVTILNGATCWPATQVDKSYSFHVTFNRGLKRKRDEPLCDVTNGLSSFPGHRRDLSSLKTASSLCYEGNVDCHNQTLKKVKLSTETGNVIVYQNAFKIDSVVENGFQGLKKLGRRLKALKSRLVEGLRGGKRSNNVFPIRSPPRKFR